MSAQPPSAPVDENRLPLDIKPLHYDITIRTDLEKLTFDGEILIDLEVAKDTSKIVFNSSNLTVNNIFVRSDAFKADQAPTSQTHDDKTERTTLDLPVILPKGTKAQLSAKFNAPLTGSMMGYYYSTWEDDGVKKYYTLTQFEPTAARRAFPCWDEPLLKATYSITLISREDTVNLSNMPAVSEEAYNAAGHEGWKITKFDKTPPVSSYLVAFANGHFEFIESSYVSPLSGKERPLRIYATKDYIPQAQFALDIKRKVLPIYEQLFDVEYPLPKLDTLIASDFDAGAMENWGLITGRTTAFCLDPNKVGVAAQKRVATVQSHEVAHMWFGDITTMEWWDNLYLNEGFATLMGEVIVIDKIFPEWKVYSEFINEHLNRALDLDAKLSSHPIEVECPDANHINQIFDALSYSKAGSVLRMLSAYVGEETFLRGVSIYLKKHLYANSVSKDLWNGIGEAANLNIAEMMDNWVSKIGFPVITVSEEPKAIIVSQDRFLETGPASEKDNQTIWQVPLSLITVDEHGKVKHDNTLVLDKKKVSIPLDTSKPFKLNHDTSGVYRTLYTPERLSKIAEEAAKENSIFSLNDRIGLVQDAFALANAGFAKVSNALNLVQLLRNEEEFLVWQGVAGNIADLANIWWEEDKVFDLFLSFRSKLYLPLVEKLGYDYNDSESPDTKQLRTLAISGAATAKSTEVIKELKARFAEFIKTGNDSRIAQDLERVTYTTAVKYGGAAEYDEVKKIYNKPRTPATRTAAISALCGSVDQALIDRTFDMVLTEARDQDIVTFFNFLGSNAKTRRQLWTFVKNNWDDIYKRFSGNTQLSYIIKSTCLQYSKESDADAFEAFFKDKDTSRFNLALQQALDTIRAHAALRKRSNDDVTQWLENWEKGAKL